MPVSVKANHERQEEGAGGHALRFAGGLDSIPSGTFVLQMSACTAKRPCGRVLTDSNPALPSFRCCQRPSQHLAFALPSAVSCLTHICLIEHLTASSYVSWQWKKRLPRALFHVAYCPLFSSLGVKMPAIKAFQGHAP